MQKISYLNKTSNGPELITLLASFPCELVEGEDYSRLFFHIDNITASLDHNPIDGSMRIDDATEIREVCPVCYVAALDLGVITSHTICGVCGSYKMPSGEWAISEDFAE